MGVTGESTSRWIARSIDGELICKVCGMEKGKRVRCCKLAPFINFEDFKRQYFGDEPVSRNTARNFWLDYLSSGMDSLKEYIQKTTTSVGV
mgnify:CR=1 FL=1